MRHDRRHRRAGATQHRRKAAGRATSAVVSSKANEYAPRDARRRRRPGGGAGDSAESMLNMRSSEANEAGLRRRSARPMAASRCSPWRRAVRRDGGSIWGRCATSCQLGIAEDGRISRIADRSCDRHAPRRARPAPPPRRPPRVRRLANLLVLDAVTIAAVDGSRRAVERGARRLGRLLARERDLMAPGPSCTRAAAPELSIAPCRRVFSAGHAGTSSTSEPSRRT